MTMVEVDMYNQLVPTSPAQLHGTVAGSINTTEDWLSPDVAMESRTSATDDEVRHILAAGYLQIPLVCIGQVMILSENSGHNLG